MTNTALIQVLVVGGAQVGKTSLCKKLSGHNPSINKDGYVTVRDQLFRRGNGALVMFSVSCYESFEYIIKLRAQILRLHKSHGSFPMILLGNKIDSNREVTFEEAQRLANALSIPYYETSLLESNEIEEITKPFLQQCLENLIARSPVFARKHKRESSCIMS